MIAIALANHLTGSVVDAAPRLPRHRRDLSLLGLSDISLYQIYVRAACAAVHSSFHVMKTPALWYAIHHTAAEPQFAAASSSFCRSVAQGYPLRPDLFQLSMHVHQTTASGPTTDCISKTACLRQNLTRKL